MTAILHQIPGAAWVVIISALAILGVTAVRHIGGPTNPGGQDQF
jgi:hypothetical protein